MDQAKKQQKITQYIDDFLNNLEKNLKDIEDEFTRDDLVEHLKLSIYKRIESRSHNPVSLVRWVKIEDVHSNDYNPNSVATNEMSLLYKSIKADGYTQPVVTIYDEEKRKYIIIDGFHRYTTMRVNKDLLEANNGRLPVVVLEKDINERMASTVRHNRARGKHSVAGMSNMVYQMLENGMSDEEICNNLGMEAEELLRLKHITGYAKLFKNAKYSKSFVTSKQVLIKKDYCGGEE